MEEKKQKDFECIVAEKSKLIEVLEAKLKEVEIKSIVINGEIIGLDHQFNKHCVKSSTAVSSQLFELQSISSSLSL